MARNLPVGEERSALLSMAEEWDRLPDQQEHASTRAHRDGILIRGKARGGLRPDYDSAGNTPGRRRIVIPMRNKDHTL
jgi:hypothetical protein